MNYLIFDLVIAALLLIFFLRGYARGFVLTLCGFLALFVAFIGANILAGLLAQPVAHAIVPMVEQGLHHALAEAVQDASAGSAALEELPLSDLLIALQDSALYRSLADAFQSAVDAGVAQVTTTAARALAEFVAAQFARTIIFLIGFVVILMVWTMISRTLDLVARLPVLSTLNRWGGACVGLLKGALLLFIAAWLLKDGLIPQQAIENTYLLKFFCTTSPLSLLA